jgi:hypothetical protein
MFVYDQRRLALSFSDLAFARTLQDLDLSSSLMALVLASFILACSYALNSSSNNSSNKSPVDMQQQLAKLKVLVESVVKIK